MIIEYRGIRLRATEEADLPLLQELYNDPETNKYTMGWDFPVSMDQQKAWFSTLKDKDTEFRAMIDVEDGSTVGTVSISHIDYKNRTVVGNGVKILKKYSGKGYGFKAIIAVLIMLFDEMGFYSFEAQHLDTQKTTQRMVEKLGFVYEGTLRKRIFKHGKRNDVLVWSINADEFNQIRARFDA